MSRRILVIDDEQGIRAALGQLLEHDPNATVVMISGHATIRTAVEATQLGAYEILEKPLDTDRILVMLRNALAHLDLREENSRLRDVGTAPYEIIGDSGAVRAMVDKVKKVGATPARAPITGEYAQALD